ncbi:Low affinity potassium transport system protein kup [Ferriphaselus amnicola]|uniref:Probable potassium transport system protein Kup n=1 Tax=Ferriphaselus amnicola TaxID=1188319 RepID=A0A2Z6GER2_9PROT|nr:potassium transporter Kup [Ferriphaselus amnicola]BBE51655.1 Low affinity potassium transport system protein kup [Ferriphaselus amnicola]
MQAAKSSLTTLTIAALGVVYGDIGTSPLYAFKEAFAGANPLPLDEANVLASLSVLFWCMMLIISVKYVWLVLRFDNQGEGGVLALTALAHRLSVKTPRIAQQIVGWGVFAAALFYGDAIITPAISVLSAVEGLSIATPQFEHWILPITVGVLIGLFLIQKQGTGKIGGLFGLVTLAWFITLGVLGVMSIAQNPVVLKALSPLYAIDFAVHHTGVTFLLLSAVFLALTGGEALYADMGHFGAKAVRVAWYTLVFPCLIINYFGQGALVLRDASAVQNPFYLLSPDWFMLPLVALATAATVIASQATISGAYSMTLQASRLGYLPRVRVLHTSDKERGQIYIPTVNWLMLVAVIVLVLQFRSSGALAAAYGIAVSGTMIITTVLAGFVVLAGTGRHRTLLLLSFALFGSLELGFFGSNLTKIASGGWFPLVLGAIIFLLLTTWKRGSLLVSDQRRKLDIPVGSFVSSALPDVPRVAGTAVYLTSDTSLVPSALFHTLKHYKVLHERVVFLHVLNEEVPYIAADQRLDIKELTPGVYRVDVRFGFREEPDIPEALRLAPKFGLEIEAMSTSYFVARSVIVDGPGALPRWRCNLFSWLTRQSEGAAAYYRLPANQVVELGTQVML